MQWKDIPLERFRGRYEVSSTGLVRSYVFPGSKGKAKKKRLTPHSGGYVYTVLHNGETTEKWLVHRLVARVFIGPCPENKEVHHINGVKTDNRARNLRYVTRKENCQLIHGPGRPKGKGVIGKGYDQKGKKNNKAKINERAAMNIYNSNLRVTELAEMYGLTHSAISQIRSRTTWKHIHECTTMIEKN